MTDLDPAALRALASRDPRALAEQLVALPPEARRAPELVAWVEAWCQETLRKYPGWFHLFDALLEAEVLPLPDHEEWVGAAIAAAPTRDGGALALLRADPPRLRSWRRVFEVEGGGETSLAAAEKYLPDGERGWAWALIQLTADGEVHVDQLLDATLDALGRGFSTFRAGWFSRFHQQLAPDLEARAARQATYARLLAAPAGPTVALALSTLDELRKAGRLDPADLAAALAPAAGAKAKGTARRALALLAWVAEAAPGQAASVARAATAGLGHKAREVQAQALDLVEAHGDPADPALVASVLEAPVVPSLAARRDAWAGPAAPRPDEAASRPDDPDLGGLRPAGPPLADPQAVADALRAALDEGAEPLAFERLLDGLSRFPSPPPAPEVQAHAARVRSRHLPENRPWPDPGEDTCTLLLAHLAEAWCGGAFEPLDPGGDRGEAHVHRSPRDRSPTCRTVLEARAAALAGRIAARQALPGLAAPTHLPAWVAPGALAQRLQAWQARGVPPDPLELSLALLRLAPSGRAAAAREARALRGPAGAALRYALGEDVPVGDDPALWLAAAAARKPGVPDPALGGRHPDLGGRAPAGPVMTWAPLIRRGGGWTWRSLRLTRHDPLPEPIPAAYLALLVHGRSSQRDHHRGRRIAGHHPRSVRWAATMTPADRSGYYAEGSELVDLDWNSAQWEVVGYLQALADPGSPLGEAGHVLLTLGLGAKEVGQRQAAAAALAATSEDGRLDHQALGRRLAAWMAEDLILPSRLAKALALAAPSSPRGVRDTLVAVLREPPLPLPRGFPALLEQLRERCVELQAPVEDHQARAGLEEIAAGKGKAARVAKALL